MGNELPKLRKKPDSTSSPGGERFVDTHDSQIKAMNLDEQVKEHALYLARMSLLDNTGLHAPYADAARYDKMIIDSQRTVYNHRFICGSAEENERWLRSCMCSTGVLEGILRKHLFVHGQRPDEFFSDTAVKFRKVYKKCFFTGQPLRFLKFTRLVPEFSHPFNFVPVNDWLVNISIRGIVDDLRNGVVLESKGSGMAWLEAHGLDALLSLRKHDMTCTEDQRKTSIDELNHVCPRDTIKGWIARIVLTLMDMYGNQSISPRWMDRELLVRWSSLPLSVEEIIHDLLVYSITKDTSPFIHLDSRERERYAKSILLRPESHNTVEPPRKYTIITPLTGYIAQDRHGEMQFLFDDVQHDEEITKAIREFNQSVFKLGTEEGGAAGLP